MVAIQQIRWWYENFFSSTGKYANNYQNEKIFEGEGVLNDEGEFKFEYKLDENFKVYSENNPDEYYETDYRYSVYALVKDKSRREISADASTLVTRGDIYLSSKTDRYIYSKGDNVQVEVKAFDFSDKPKAASFTAMLYKTGFYYEKTRELVKTFTGIAKEHEAGTITFPVENNASEGGYELNIISKDSKGVEITTSSTFYVGSYRWINNDDKGGIQIITDKEGYMPGDTCKAIIRLPQSDVYPLMTYEGRNIIDYRVEHTATNIISYIFIIDDKFSGNFNLNVSFIKNGSYYEGKTPVLVVPKNKFLNVEIFPSGEVYRPQDSGEVKIKITDDNGVPVKNAEISLGVVDESIYSLYPDYSTDIRKNFYYTDDYYHKTNTEYAQEEINISMSRVETVVEKMLLRKFNDSSLVPVSGRFLDESNYPISGGDIIINGNILASVTSYEGNFKFKVPPGSYILSAKARGKENAVFKHININPGADYDLTLYSEPALNFENNFILKDSAKTMQGKGSIAGYILKAENGLPLAGVIVEVHGKSLSTVTDDKGYFIIENVEKGSHSIFITHSEYDVQLINLHVKDQNITIANSYLHLTTGASNDEIDVESYRSEVEVEQSGRIIYSEEINNSGIRGINNIVSITSGVVTDESGANINIRGGRTNLHEVILEGGIGVEYGNVLSGIINLNYKKAAIRSEFKDAVYWSPFIVTDETGTGKVKFKYPDNLTSWRMTAKVVTPDSRFGHSSVNVITRKDFMIRAEAPRFLQQNDEVIISTIIHNYLNTSKKTKIKVIGENVYLKDTVSKEVNIGAGEDVRIDWPIRVLNAGGTAKLYAEALTDEESDALEIVIPVQPKGLKQNISSVSDFSDMYKTEVINVNIPESVDVNTTEMKFSVSPSLAAVIYRSIEKLADYPYGCIEQTLSRFIPTIVVADTYKKLGIPINEQVERELPLMIRAGFQKIIGYQKPDGGWGWWGSYNESDPFMSAYVLYALTLAKNAGYEVNPKTYKEAKEYLADHFEGSNINAPTRAFMLYSYSLASDSIPDIEDAADDVYFNGTDNFTKVLLSLVYYNIGNTGRALRILEDFEVSSDNSHEGYISWQNPDNADRWENDKMQIESFALKAFLLIKPESPIKEKLVRSILMKKNESYLLNTQQSAMMIFALTDYIKFSQELDPDYNIKVYVNDKFSFEKSFTAADIFSKDFTSVLEPGILKAGNNKIKIVKEGSGKVYFSANTSYFSTDFRSHEKSNGFIVKREYYKLEQIKVENKKNNEDEDEDEKNEIKYVYKKVKIEDALKPGEVVFVKTTVNTRGQDHNYKYFMLEDPLPAGFEFLKDEWAYPILSEREYDGEEDDYDDNYWQNWYTHREVWDDRISFFLSGIDNHTREFTYLLRAQIPGEYYVNPARGMLMYYTDVCGSSNDFKLKIED